MRHNLTKLGAFINANGVKPADLAHLIGLSRKRLYLLRFGVKEPTRPEKIWITLGCRRLLQREVLATELFD